MKLFHFARISLQQRGIESHDNIANAKLSWLSIPLSLQQRGIESHDNFAFAIFLWY